MSSFKFIHTSDLHLDSPFKGIKSLAPEHAAEVLDSTFRAFTRVVDYCIELDVDFLLIAGVIFDSENRSVRAEIFFVRAMERLSVAGIKVYLIYGNHDFMQSGKSNIAWPNNVYTFSEAMVERVEFVRNEVSVAAIYGRSYPERAFAENIIPDFKKALTGDLFAIGVHHTNVDGNQEYAQYSPASLGELKKAGYDYWALGHIHKQAILSEKEPMIVYAGNTQGRHINERGVKACHYVEVVNKLVVESKWLPVSPIVWEELIVDISSVERLDQLLSLIDKKIEELQNKYQQPLIIRLKIVGRSELYFAVQKKEHLEEIEVSLNEHYNRSKPWIIIESVKSDLKPAVDFASLVAYDSFLADYLKEYDKKLAQLQSVDESEDDEPPEYAQALLNNRLFKKHFRKFTDEDWLEIAELAKGYAIDSLYKEDEE